MNEGKKLDLVYEDKIDELQAFQDENNDGIPTHTYQQWNVVGSKADSVTHVLYNPQILFTTHVEDWAHKEKNRVYLEYDPINLIWTDSVRSGGDLITKVDNRMSSRGWNGICPSSDLWINISGTWTKQTEHFKDPIGSWCNQYHVRAWAINDNLVIGSAHRELLKLKPIWEQVDIEHVINRSSYLERDTETQGGFYHAVIGFEVAETSAAEEFSRSCWDVDRNSHYMGNQYTRNTFQGGVLVGTADNDGYATVISCS